MQNVACFKLATAAPCYVWGKPTDKFRNCELLCRVTTSVAGSVLPSMLLYVLICNCIVVAVIVVVVVLLLWWLLFSSLVNELWHM